jgi:hypothetical protein
MLELLGVIILIWVIALVICGLIFFLIALPIGVVGGIISGIVSILENRSKSRLWKMYREGKLPRPWDFYEKEREIRTKSWLTLEMEVLKELNTRGTDNQNPTILR